MNHHFVWRLLFTLTLDLKLAVIMSAFPQTFPNMAIPGFPPMIAQGGNRFPMYAGLPVFPGMQIGSFEGLVTNPAFIAPKPLVTPHYSQSELDMLLYGYAKSRTPGSSHALSGLNLADSKSGLEKIGNVNKTPGRAQNTVIEDSSLPEGVIIQQVTFAGIQHSSAFTTRLFEKGHMFGPFQGKIVYTSEIKTNDGNSSMWEIFMDEKLKYFIDGRGSAGNWMTYVNCARYSQEQNLNAVQVGEEIYYQTSRDIPEGKELLVWYGDTYNLFMGIPVGLKLEPEGSELKASSTAPNASDANGYSCERCGKVFAYKYYKDKHLKYTRCVDQGDRKFPCNLCSRSFEKRDRLRIHILHVHEKHRPHKCTVCNKCFSQSSSLNKHMRVHSGERPYKCVYCNKAFTASSILRTHIRQHSGEKPFKCKFCGKAFASHAAHDSHVRRTHAKDKGDVDSLTCKLCPQTFSKHVELAYHMNTEHKDRNCVECSVCGESFSTQYDLYLHSTFCLASPQQTSPTSSFNSTLTDDECFPGHFSAKKEEIDVVG